MMGDKESATTCVPAGDGSILPVKSACEINEEEVRSSELTGPLPSLALPEKGHGQFPYLIKSCL